MHLSKSIRPRVHEGMTRGVATLAYPISALWCFSVDKTPQLVCYLMKEGNVQDSHQIRHFVIFVRCPTAEASQLLHWKICNVKFLALACWKGGKGLTIWSKIIENCKRWNKSIVLLDLHDFSTFCIIKVER